MDFDDTILLISNHLNRCISILETKKSEQLKRISSELADALLLLESLEPEQTEDDGGGLEIEKDKQAHILNKIQERIKKENHVPNMVFSSLA